MGGLVGTREGVLEEKKRGQRDRDTVHLTIIVIHDNLSNSTFHVNTVHQRERERDD